jgi:hypothetical protein
VAKQTALKMSVRLDGAYETLAKFRSLPKDASKQLRERSLKLATVLADRIKAAAESDVSPQARLWAPTVRPVRDRTPMIRIGGNRRVGRRRVPVWGILFGSEFGSNQYAQFGKPHHGQEPLGPAFGVAHRNADDIAREWHAAADEVVAKFTAGDIGGEG